MPCAIDACTHLVEIPPGTPSGFPVAQAFSEEGAELDAPFTEGFVADHNAALVQQFLDVPVTQGKAIVQPNRVLDDGHRETVARGFRVSHGRSAYPDPFKATQPFELQIAANSLVVPTICLADPPIREHWKKFEVA